MGLMMLALTFESSSLRRKCRFIQLMPALLGNCRGHDAAIRTFEHRGRAAQIGCFSKPKIQVPATKYRNVCAAAGATGSQTFQTILQPVLGVGSSRNRAHKQSCSFSGG